LHRTAKPESMIWLAYFILGFLALRLLVALSNLLTRQ
jgi:hypothetical protein